MRLIIPVVYFDYGCIAFAVCFAPILNLITSVTTFEMNQETNLRTYELNIKLEWQSPYDLRAFSQNDPEITLTLTSEGQGQMKDFIYEMLYKVSNQGKRQIPSFGLLGHILSVTLTF